jgi:hypothetical protein
MVFPPVVIAKAACPLSFSESPTAASLAEPNDTEARDSEKQKDASNYYAYLGTES